MPPLTAVAIDLGSRSTKVAWVTAARQGQAAWHVEHRPRSPADSPEQLAGALEALLRPMRRRRFDVPVLLAAPSAHVRRLTLAAPHPRAIPAALRERIARVFPFDPARCRYGYRILDQGLGLGVRRYTLQVAACDAERLQGDVELLRRIGWSPSHVHPSALALAALLPAHEPPSPEAVLLLDVGARRSVSALVAGGHVVFAREVSFGSDDLTDALMAEVMVGEQRLQLSWEQAESLKRRAGLLDDASAQQAAEGPIPPDLYHAMLRPVLEQWLGEIRRTIAFGVQGSADAGEQPDEALTAATPTRLLLCGGGSELPGFDQWLSRQLGMPVEPLAVGPAEAGHRAFAVACGLLASGGAAAPAAPARPRRRGEPGINLLSQGAQQGRRLIRTERILILGLGVLAVGLWVATAALQLQHRSVRRGALPLEQRRHALEPVTGLMQTVASRMAVLAVLAQRRGVSVGWFKALAHRFPNPVRLTELAVSSGGEVHLAGQAQEREQTAEAYVSELAMWLAQAQVCQDVQLGASGRNTQQTQLVDFSLTCRRQ